MIDSAFHEPPFSHSLVDSMVKAAGNGDIGKGMHASVPMANALQLLVDRILPIEPEEDYQGSLFQYARKPETYERQQRQQTRRDIEEVIRCLYRYCN
mgnify:CR=1 FL=1